MMLTERLSYKQELALICIRERCQGVEGGCTLLPTECGRWGNSDPNAVAYGHLGAAIDEVAARRPTSAMVPRLRSAGQAARVLFRRTVWVLALVAAYHAMHSVVWGAVELVSR